MPSYPNRCQHIKVNGTQCGSPALRRNRFCYFHKLHRDEVIALSTDRAKSARAQNARARRQLTLTLPVLEDANSIQVSLMQIMRLIVSGQIDAKTAGLLLYALQTASSNLGRTSFEPLRNSVILDPAAVGDTPLGAVQLWTDEDFEEEDEQEGEEDDDADDEDDEEADEETTGSTDNKDADQSPDEIIAQARKQIGEDILKGFPSFALELAARQKQNSG